METLRIQALAQHLGVDNDDLNVCSYDDQVIEYGNEEYLVVTDEEADDLWDAELEMYLDECLEIPENIKPYFDREAWKSDARQDGRGHSLSGYDGEEHEETVYHDDFDGETYCNEVDSIEIDGVMNDLGERTNFYIFRRN